MQTRPIDATPLANKGLMFAHTTETDIELLVRPRRGVSVDGGMLRLLW